MPTQEEKIKYQTELEDALRTHLTPKPKEEPKENKDVEEFKSALLGFTEAIKQATENLNQKPEPEEMKEFSESEDTQNDGVVSEVTNDVKGVFKKVFKKFKIKKKNA